MKIIMNGIDITQKLAEHAGEHVAIELIDGKKRICWGGVIEVESDAVPYNPLMDTDCGTDAMIGRAI